MVDANRLVLELTAGSWGMTALAVCLETGMLANLESSTVVELAAEAGIDESLAGSLLEVVAALGLVELRDGRIVADPGLAALTAGPGALALMTSSILQQNELLRSAHAGAPVSGWSHFDPYVLETQGTISAALPRTLEQHAFAHMDGMPGMLEQPGSAFLDVGAGVGAISIALCRSFPELRAVGLEPAEAPLKLALANVERQGMGGRIEIRAQRIEQLEDESAFHLAQIPVQFLPTDVVEQALQRVLKALVPGGWVVIQVVAPPGPELFPAVARLWNRIWGGEALPADQVVAMLESAGYTGTTVLPDFPGPPTRFVIGRRP